MQMKMEEIREVIHTSEMIASVRTMHEDAETETVRWATRRDATADMLAAIRQSDTTGIVNTTDVARLMDTAIRVFQEYPKDSYVTRQLVRHAAKEIARSQHPAAEKMQKSLDFSETLTSEVAPTLIAAWRAAAKDVV